MELPIIIGITGASGAIYGIELLRFFQKITRPVHLILTKAGARTLFLETDYTVEKVSALAVKTYDENEFTAPLASGSFPVAGMVIAPCSIKTLSAIAYSYNHNLLVRAADTQLKERRPIILMVRETPLHQGHLELMARVASLGGIILPPIPAYYHRPKKVIDIVHQSIGKVLDQLNIKNNLYARWRDKDIN